MSGSGASLLTRCAGSNRLSRIDSRGLVASFAIPASASESQIYIYSANIGLLSIRWYCKGLNWENFRATL